MTARRPPIGIHVSIAGKLSEAIDRAEGNGCETMQIFESSPRMWRSSPFDPAQLELFKKKRREAGITPLVVHSSYLINICSQDAELLAKSIESAAQALSRCEMLDADYYVLHLPSPGRDVPAEMLLDTIGAALTRLLDLSGKVEILLENTSGSGFSIGSDFGHLGAVFDYCASDRLGFCLDTCHAFGAGYDLRDEASVERTLGILDSTVSLGRLKAIHSNDSKAELASKADRHEHIGQGSIGDEGFKALLRRPELGELPFILETPGSYEDDGRNIAHLKSLRDGSAN